MSKTKTVAKNTTATTNATIIVATTSNVTTLKQAKHNKKLPVVKSTRTKMVKLLNESKGRFFTSTHIDKDGNPRTMNCVKKNNGPTELGYITVYSILDKAYRMVNPQTITDLSINGTHYVAKK